MLISSMYYTVVSTFYVQFNMSKAVSSTFHSGTNIAIQQGKTMVSTCGIPEEKMAMVI